MCKNAVRKYALLIRETDGSMLAKCATCNKTFIKKADETECPGCVTSGPTRDLPPVVGQRREREIPDLREGRNKSPRVRGADAPEPETPRRRFPVGLVFGIVLLLGGLVYTFLQQRAGKVTAYGPIAAFIGVLNVLFAIYDGARRKTVYRKPASSDDE